MKLLVFARRELAERGLPPQSPALLLEGSWPAGRRTAWRRSLDEVIDDRFAWIDQQAAEWAELLSRRDSWADGRDPPAECIAPAFLNVLGLRYALVKLLRPLAYFARLRPLRRGDRVELVAAAGRDEDYAELLREVCRAAGADFCLRRVRGQPRRAGRSPHGARWRRWSAWGADLCRPRPVPGRRNVVLCGNPRVLDPVCRELLHRRLNLWWLYDRFAVRSWLRWQAAGVGQLVCDSGRADQNRLQPGRLSVPVCRRLTHAGVSLAGPVQRWLAHRLAIDGARQTRLVEQLEAHFRRLRPDAVVLDQDATPLARAAVAVGRRYGAFSLVVQHGAPYCRFGFAPLAADRILVWGQSSRGRLIAWGVPPQRIRVTGCPHAEELYAELASRARHGPRQRSAHRPTFRARTFPDRRWRILLLATVPPRDDRPDAVALRLTGRTYTEMLRTAFAAVADLRRAELIVKLHPRAPDDPAVRSMRVGFPSLPARLVRSGRLERWLRGVDCVLSCGSSAGVEATLAGLPVIQLAPPGASAWLPHEQWAMAGTAHDARQLQALLTRILQEPRPAAEVPDPGVFGDFKASAAARVADEILALAAERDAASRLPESRSPIAA